MAINWSKGLDALSQGLLRQQQIGALMYTGAAEKETARKAGELKKGENVYKALLKRAELESEHLDSLGTELAKNPPEWDEEGNMTSGAEALRLVVRQQGRADAAWRAVYESQGIKSPKPKGKDFASLAETALSRLKGQELKDLVTSLGKDKSSKRYKEAMKSVGKIVNAVGLGGTERESFREALVNELLQKDISGIKGKMTEGMPRSGREWAALTAGYLGDIPATLINAPGRIGAGLASMWYGNPYEAPYTVYDPIYGEEYWRRMFGMDPRGPQTQEEAEEAFPGRPFYGGVHEPHNFQGGLIRKGEQKDYSPDAMKERGW